MKKKLFLASLIFTLFLIPMAFSYASENECSDIGKHNPTIVYTSKTNYQLGETIDVYGCTINDIKGVNLSIFHSDNSDDLIQGFATVPLPSSNAIWNEFSGSFTTDDLNFENGIYVINVDVDGVFTYVEVILGNSSINQSPLGLRPLQVGGLLILSQMMSIFLQLNF